MVLKPLEENVSIHQTLGDEPNVVDGLSAAQLKAKFDKAAEIIKQYINSQVVPAVNTPKSDPQLQERVTKLETAVADLQYVPIAFKSIRNSSPVNELGQTITGVELFWDTNKSPVSTLLDGVSVVNDPEWAGTDNNSYTEDKTWTVTVTDERGAKATATTAAKFYNGVYYGAAAKPVNDEDEVVFDSAFILSLEKKLQGNRELTFTANASDVDDFIWFCVPVAYGECVFAVGGFDGGFTLVDTIAFTNAHGYTENYRIYRSDYGGLGETTVEVS